MWAVQKGNVAMITAMVDRGADVNLTDLVSGHVAAYVGGCVMCEVRREKFWVRHAVASDRASYSLTSVALAVSRVLAVRFSACSLH
jgi:hypothetical protein